MIGSGELVVVMGAILLLFGGKKLPEFARNLGLGIHEFKKACQGDASQQEMTPTEKKCDDLKIDPP